MGFDRLVRGLAVDRVFNLPAEIPEKPVLIIIPAYNEAENLRHVLPALPKNVMGKSALPLVVDDGSTDNTMQICSQFKIPVARNIINRGGGAALRAGFDIALDINARAIVTMDGDGQHRIEDIETLVEPILNDSADLVVGSRMLGEMERYSRLRYWGVVLFGRMISVILGRRVTDPASGFRAFGPAVLESCLMVQDQYHTAELIIEAAKRDLRIVERPIVIKKRISGQSKKGKNFKYALYFLRTILRTWVR